MIAQFAFAQMMMCALLLLPQARNDRSACLFALLMLAGCGYLLGVLALPLERLSGLWWVQQVAANSLAGLFWLVSLSVFADRHELKVWHYALASLTLLIPLASHAIELTFGFDLRGQTGPFNALKFASMALELALISHALVLAIVNWQADLIQERRYMRAGMIVVTATYLFTVIVIEQVLRFDWPWRDTLKYSCLVVLMLGIYFLLFTTRRDGLFAPRVKVERAIEKQPPKDSPELTRIVAAMVADCLYRREGLTIAALSKHVAIQEYRLRQLINGELGYRNFNDFLNHYRIAEVSEKLSDPALDRIPILTIALDSGFRSLSSFNRAFKNIHRLTPTEFRSQVRFANPHGQDARR